MGRRIKGAVLRTALLVAVMTVLCGCTNTRYVPVETVRTEYVGKDNTELMNVIKALTERLYQKERQVDSLMQSNRELLVLSEKGDTLRHDRETIVYRASHREKELERLLESKSDSIRELRQRLESVKSDSIPVPYPVERKLTWWQQTKMDLGGFALGGLVTAVCIAVIWLIKTFRK
ncbi:hypothetical protein [uncultured Duncaniella sp.]|uniref:hypothetical protein n=1 Tax=uncultured Duncaniella sp. TaxID=2768039 RepID=UPI0025A9ED28|nr:hypothetical protein [uncultured Duncaniella sp.]